MISTVAYKSTPQHLIDNATVYYLSPELLGYIHWNVQTSSEVSHR